MRNRYGGSCVVCGEWVEPGDGHFERRGGRWIVVHQKTKGHGADKCDRKKPDTAKDSRSPSTVR